MALVSCKGCGSRINKPLQSVGIVCVPLSSNQTAVLSVTTSLDGWKALAPTAVDVPRQSKILPIARMARPTVRTTREFRPCSVFYERRSAGSPMTASGHEETKTTSSARVHSTSNNVLLDGDALLVGAAMCPAC
jgi:hypothetical protein